MTKVNAAEMRAVEGGYTVYSCDLCKSGLHKNVASKTAIYWHVVIKHKKKLLDAWGYISKKVY